MFHCCTLLYNIVLQFCSLFQQDPIMKESSPESTSTSYNMKSLHTFQNFPRYLENNSHIDNIKKSSKSRY